MCHKHLAPGCECITALHALAAPSLTHERQQPYRGSFPIGYDPLNSPGASFSCFSAGSCNCCCWRLRQNNQTTGACTMMLQVPTWISWVHAKLVPHGLCEDRVPGSIVIPVDNVVRHHLIGPLVHECVADDGSSSCTTHAPLLCIRESLCFGWCMMSLACAISTQIRNNEMTTTLIRAIMRKR